jgi:hypothetical protein
VPGRAPTFVDAACVELTAHSISIQIGSALRDSKGLRSTVSVQIVAHIFEASSVTVNLAVKYARMTHPGIRACRGRKVRTSRSKLLHVEVRQSGVVDSAYVE